MMRCSVVPASALAAVLVVAPAEPVSGQALGLEEVVSSALATHPALEAERQRWSAAVAGAGEVRGGWWPSVWAQALATRYQEPMVVAPLHGFDPMDLPVFDRTLLQGHAGADWTLFDGGLRRSRVAAAEGLVSAAAGVAAVAADAVLEEAVSSYLAALTAAAVLGAHERQAAALEAERARAVRMFDEGRSPRVAVLRTEAALSRAEAERAASAARHDLALRRLARVSGLDPARVAGAALVDVSPSPSAPASRDSLLARARASHPALAAARGRADAAERELGAARSSWLPRVSVVGRYSAYGSGATSFEPEWSVGAQLGYAVFNGGARARGVERAAAGAAAARAELALATRSVEDAVDAALAAHRSAAARVAALGAAVAQSEEVARVEALALEEGAGVQTDYLRAEAELLSARAALAEARHDAAAARVRLARASGDLSLERLADLLIEVER